ncbi:MAG: sulfatase-like hydrolase/transferase [bacterium]|nr:sulfatase-like hydrolase/transferase [bacterium]
MTTRREFLQHTGLGLAGLTCIPLRAMGKAQNSFHTNFVFILCDDLGYGDLGCYGHPRIQTPNLDQLAREGLRLTDCYAAAPVCSPSRAGIMTGRNPTRCRIPDWIPPRSGIYLHPQEITVATLLRQAGYTTCHSGKWHLSDAEFFETRPTPGDHGFDHWFSTQNNALPSHRNPANFVRQGERVGSTTGYSSTLIVDEAIEFLHNRDEHNPFALFVWFHSPHEPIATAEYYHRLYADVEEQEQAIYYGNVSQMDAETGRLLRALDRLNLRESTFVMFTSDNGPETLNRYRGAQYSYGSPGPLRGMKLHLYEGGIRVPGLIRWPGHTQPGQVSHEPVNGTDILPTFCAIAAAPLPQDRALDGASLLPLLQGQAVDRPKPLYWRYDRALSPAKTALRQGEWKILVTPDGTGVELYNLREDPCEQVNRAQSEPTRTTSLLAELKAIHTEIENDPISAPK